MSFQMTEEQRPHQSFEEFMAESKRRGERRRFAVSYLRKRTNSPELQEGTHPDYDERWAGPAWWYPTGSLSRSGTIRELLIHFGNGGSPNDFNNDYGDELPPGELRDLIFLTDFLFDDEFSRGSLTELAMEHSLCPLHFVDWAICFDDDDPSCAQIRTVLPHSHDT